MDTEDPKQHKHERSRTRWTASLDKAFADLIVEQIQLGNRPNNVFDKKTWNNIREQFNRHTDSNFNNNQLRKHLDVLRTRFSNLRSVYNQNTEIVMDESSCFGFDLWDDIGMQSKSRIESTKTKVCPIYDQLCTIFLDSSADGKYAQSSHYEDPGKSISKSPGSTSHPEGETPLEDPSSSQPVQRNPPSGRKATKSISERKRKRPSDTQTSPSQNKKEQEKINAMGKALLKMVAAAKLRIVAKPQSDDRYTITNCIMALDEIKGIDERMYFDALDLFENSNLRAAFISLKAANMRLIWLQGKCGNLISH